MDFSSLNKQQKDAVMHANGPLLIVAGAGTGKTTVLTHRVAWLIEQELAKPEEILCLTFTDKAAGEMEERVDKLLPFGYVDLWVMTFHAFAERLLKQHGLHIGLPPEFRVLDQTAQWMLIHQHFDRFDLNYYKPMGKPTKFIGAMLTHFSRAKDEGILPEAYLDYAQDLQLDTDSESFVRFKKSTLGDDIDEDEASQVWQEEVMKRQELAGAYHTYQKLLREQDALDFGDLILYVRELFKQRAGILSQYRKQFKYILVDEFQDTNWAQYDLLNLLAPPDNNITVVGDDDQSIYKFRGASLSNILGFKNDYSDTEQVVLNQNYRSSQNILDLAHHFIQHNNPHRLEYQLGSAEDVQEAAEEKQMDLSGFQAIDKQLQANVDKKEGIIKHLHFQSLQDEASGVAQKILELRNQNSDLNWGDFAILVRANSSAEPFLQQLTLAEIPYQFLASQGLFTQPQILDILSYLKLLGNHHDSTALYRLLILPTVDLGNDDLMELLRYADKQAVSLYDALKQAPALDISEEGQEICRTVLSRVDQHTTEAKRASVSEVAMGFVEDYGLRQYFEQMPAMEQKDLYRLLNHFWSFMQDFEAQAEEKTASAFLEYVDLAKEAGDTGALPQDAEEGPETVKVMTIHGSKGLEFAHVFIVNLVDRRFPAVERKAPLPLPEDFVHELQAGDDPHLEEERRLFYVALTRAKQGLFLTSGQDYGGARKKKLSRFLIESGFEQTEPVSLEQPDPFAGKRVKNPQKRRDEEIDYSKYLPKTFSYTQLKTFQTCPWQYKYAFILRIPVRGKYTFSFGKSMHHTLERFFNRILEKKATQQSDLFGNGQEQSDLIPSKKELLELYDECWLDEWYDSPRQKQEYYKKGKEMIESFYEIHQGNWPNVEAVEKPFTLKVGNYKLRGSIDRVDRGQQGLRLIDYKTGNVPKNDRSLDKDQLTIYQMAAEEVLGEEVEELTYYYLTENVEKSFITKDKQKEKLKEKIISTLDEMTQSDFEANPSKMVCQNCDFKTICPYSMA